MNELIQNLRKSRFIVLDSLDLDLDEMLDPCSIVTYDTREAAERVAKEAIQSYIDGNTTNDGDLIMDDGFDPSFSAFVFEAVSVSRIPEPSVIQDQLKQVKVVLANDNLSASVQFAA